MIERLERQLGKEKRDLQILDAVIREHPIGIVKLAQETDVPQHKVRYSLRMLENDGLIEATPQGAIPTDDIASDVETINRGIDDLIARLHELESL
ncbi:winged helix-turn-helix transcriptional regulator [Natronomonas sp. EA1]|uniref:winged helix-turn-helix transcriptional regulator n=1 Tax=Natronomonas sp. EA1 TaxID=3421655 RepID=UPI003EB8D764